MIKLTHYSKDNNIKVFTPRVPKYRLIGENNVLPRICASISTYGCINAFPYRSDLVINSYNKDVGVYLTGYDFYVSKKDALTPDIVSSLGVPDAKHNNEFWITKRCKPYRKQIIRMVDFKLSNYNRYTWEYYGEITKMEYQYSIEPNARILRDTIYDYRNYIKLKRLFNKFGIKLLDESINEYYFGYGKAADDYALPKNISNTKKKVIKIKYKIPANVDLYYAWNLIIKDNIKFEKKKIRLLNPNIVQDLK